MLKYVFSSLIAAALLLSSNHMIASPPEDSVKKLIDDLSSENGQDRVTATKALFEKGETGLRRLKQGGAKQISPHGTIKTRRLDMVYSLMEGFRKNPAGGLAGYKTASFGLHLEQGVTEKEVAEMGRKYGFTISGMLRADGQPQCYVKLRSGKALEAVIKDLMLNEPTVVTINLNYFES